MASRMPRSIWASTVRCRPVRSRNSCFSTTRAAGPVSGARCAGKPSTCTELAECSSRLLPRGPSVLENLVADIRYTLRWLRRSPAFTLVAILSFAIGIGFNSALFTLVDTMLFRPLTVERPDRLVDVFTSSTDTDQYATSSYPDYLDLRAQNGVFSDMLAYSPAMAAVNLPDRSRLAMGEIVSGSYFPLLGVRAAAGRLLTPDDDRPGAPRALVISHSLWTREFGASPSAVGQTMRIHGQSYTIVGVAPASFTGMLPLLSPELWLPLTHIDDVENGGII